MSGDQTLSKITVYGHRGARGIYPENTMEGFQYLFDIGTDAVEIDVQNAAGRVPVLTHDAHVTKSLSIHGGRQSVVQMLVRDTSADELAKLPFAGRYVEPGENNPFPDQARLPKAKIPTFDDFCLWASGHEPLVLNVEIKSHADNATLFDPPHVIVPDVVQILTRYNLLERSVLSSFDWRVLHEAAQCAPELKRGYLTLERTHGSSMVPNILDGSAWMNGEKRADHANSLPQTVADLGGNFWCPYYKDITHEAVKAAQALGVQVNVWTVNKRADIELMRDMGVNGIITDYPARVRNILASHGQV